MPKRVNKRIASEMIADLTSFRDVLRRGERVDRRFTVKTVALRLEPEEFSPEAIRALWARLNVSQAVFARIVGASPATIEAWEQGVRRPTPMARRLLGEIRRNRGYWIKVLRSRVVAAAG